MMILTGLALFVVLLGMGSKEIGLQRDNYKPYLVITGIVVTLVMGLRHQYMGADTGWYINTHEQLAAMPSFKPYYDLWLADSDFLFSEIIPNVFVCPVKLVLCNSALFIGFVKQSVDAFL